MEGGIEPPDGYFKGTGPLICFGFWQKKKGLGIFVEARFHSKHLTRKGQFCHPQLCRP
jgi:hypothetical protein